MKLTLLTVLTLPTLLFAGCSSITATSTTASGTNSFKAVAFLTVNKTERLDVAAQNKSSSKLIGAKNTEISGDVQMIQALSEALGAAMAAGAKAAVKP